MALVTFCVPTLWRPSLQLALDSIEDQTDDDWQCVVTGDGNYAYGDPYHPDGPAYIHNMKHHWRDGRKIHYGWVHRTGSAGLTRNMAIKVARHTYPSEWIAFLDDDDELEPDYVAHLRQHSERTAADVIIFRMYHPRFGVLPHPTSPMLEHGHVGISFAVRSDFLPEDPFIKENLDRPGVNGNEDITLIKRLQEMGAGIFISPYVDYLVRPGVKVVDHEPF